MPPRTLVAARFATATTRDVAEAAGVSISAVSRTFTPGASVSAKTRERVTEAAERLGYRPNRLARSLTTGRTELIGLVSNHFANPTFMEVFDLFTRELQARGLRPLLANLGEDEDGKAAIDMVRQYNVDASGSCSKAEADRLSEFFKSRLAQVNGAVRGLAQTSEQILLCSALKAKQDPKSIFIGFFAGGHVRELGDGAMSASAVAWRTRHPHFDQLVASR